MKTLIETTTGTIASQMILISAGDYAGEFQDEAFDMIAEASDKDVFDMTTELCDKAECEANSWADIMFDQNGNVYAIWAEDALTCWNASLIYIQLDREDCPVAFKKMQEKLIN